MAVTSLKDFTTGIGTVSYGSHTFGAVRRVRVEISPKYDEADRGRPYNVFTFTVDALIYAASEASQSTALDSIYKILSTPGLALVVSGCGVGTFNVSGNPGDVAWGPKPRPFKLNPTAGLIAAEITWAVDVALPACTGAASYADAMEFNYSIDYSISERGLTARTISGYASVAQTRPAGSTAVSRTADSLRETIAARFPILSGFKRTQSYRDRSDRSRLDFSITDTQLDQDDAFPVGITDADLTFSIGTMNAFGHKWSASLSGSLTHAGGYPRDHGWQMFYLIAQAKIQELRANLPASAVLPASLRCERSIFGRTVRASVAWIITHPLKDWAPVGVFSGPGTFFGDWQQSMAVSFGPRGNMGLKHSAGQDWIVGPCDSNIANVQASGGGLTSGSGGGTNSLSSGGPMSAQGLTAQNNYLFFDNKLVAGRVQEVSEQKTIQTYNGDAVLTSASLSDLAAKHGLDTGRPVDGEEIGYQYQSTPTERVVMIGRSMRVGQEPSVPALEVKGNSQPIELVRVVSIRPVTRLGGLPVFFATWNITYGLPKGIAAAGLSAPLNPDTGTQGERDVS